MGGVPTFFINGIECAHYMPGGRFAISEASPAEGPQITIPLKCAWDDRWNLVKALRGTCIGTIGAFTRNQPYALPDNSNLVCVSTGQFQYIGSGADDSGDLDGVFAVVPANFSPVPWQFQDGDPSGQNDASGQAWTVTKIKPSAEVYQPTGGSYYVGPFPSTTALDEASVGFLRANCEIQVTRKFLPAMPLYAINAAIGDVNYSPMSFGGATYGTAYVLLIAAEASEPYFDCMGNPVMDYTCTYLARTSASWWRVQDRGGAWQLVNTKADGSGSYPFGISDFSTLPR